MGDDKRSRDGPGGTPIDAAVNRLSAIERRLAEIAECLPSAPQPDFAHLRESLHALRNFAHVLMGLVEQLGSRMEGTLAAIERLTDIARTIQESAGRIEAAVGAALPDDPLLMRDIWKIHTEGTELTLVAINLLQGAVFAAGSEALMRSALFAALANISDKPVIWGLCFSVLGLATLAAFFSRRRTARRMMAAANLLFLGFAGFLTMFLQPGVAGWVMNVIGFGLSVWVFFRGPSRAI